MREGGYWMHFGGLWCLIQVFAFAKPRTFSMAFFNDMFTCILATVYDKFFFHKFNLFVCTTQQFYFGSFLYNTPQANELLGWIDFNKFSLLTAQTSNFLLCHFFLWQVHHLESHHASFSELCTCHRKKRKSGAYRRENKSYHIQTCHRKLARLLGALGLV